MRGVGSGFGAGAQEQGCSIYSRSCIWRRTRWKASSGLSHLKELRILDVGQNALWQIGVTLDLPHLTHLHNLASTVASCALTAPLLKGHLTVLQVGCQLASVEPLPFALFPGRSEPLALPTVMSSDLLVAQAEEAGGIVV